MENNFIEMAASAGHAVAYTIGPIFKHSIDCVQLYFTCSAAVGNWVDFLPRNYFQSWGSFLNE